MTDDRKLAAALGALELEAAAISRLEAAIKRVRDLHSVLNPDEPQGWWQCAACYEGGDLGEHASWPCDTIQVLDQKDTP
jgi:hypothetical protein